MLNVISDSIAVKHDAHDFEDKYNKLNKIDNDIVYHAMEILLISSGNIDSFFLNVMSNLENADYNTSDAFCFDNTPKATPLVYAIQSKNNDNVKFLLSINSVDPCYVGNFEIVKYFIDKFYLNKEKPLINIFQITNESGECAIHLATRKNHLVI